MASTARNAVKSQMGKLHVNTTRKSEDGKQILQSTHTFLAYAKGLICLYDNFFFLKSKPVSPSTFNLAQDFFFIFEEPPGHPIILLDTEMTYDPTGH